MVSLLDREGSGLVSARWAVIRELPAVAPPWRAAELRAERRLIDACSGAVVAIDGPLATLEAGNTSDAKG